MSTFDLTPEFVAQVRETGAGIHQDNLWQLIDDLAREVQCLRGENKKFRTFIEGVKEFDPRCDIYANELTGDCNEVLGLCRCCGEEVCEEDDDA